MTLSVVVWKWSRPGYRATFTGEHVNAMSRMVARHYARPHRFICVTDDPTGIAPGIEIVPDFGDFLNVPSPHGAGAPSCYRRLRGFHPNAARWFGERFVCLDLDMVAVADLVSLWDRPEDFVGLQDPFYPKQLNGSMWLLSAGARPDVWTDFDPARSPAAARSAGFRGSDQAWLSHKLMGGPMWTTADGVYSYRRDVERTGKLPDGARMVSFHGTPKPWQVGPMRLDWVRENWGVV